MKAILEGWRLKRITMLTPERLKYLLDYNQNTGIFKWKKPTNKRIIRGRIAGGIESKGYRQIKIDGIKYLAHRLAWFLVIGRWPFEQIDHINGIKDDNRWKNLREATCSQNKMNCGLSKRNKSGYKGVFWRKELGKWRASIKKDQKRIYLGHFDTKEGAAKAYNEAALKYFGEFARVNEL